MPEWAERQLLHPEERRGREGKEGERGGRDGGRERCRPVGRQEPGAAVARRPRGRAVTPSRSPLARGRGNRVGKRRGDGGRDGTDTGLGC